MSNLLFTGKIESARSINSHALNSFIVLADLLLSRAPMRVHHFLYTFLFVLAYVIFTVVYWAAGGQNHLGQDFTYLPVAELLGAPGSRGPRDAGGDVCRHPALATTSLRHLQAQAVGVWKVPEPQERNRHAGCRGGRQKCIAERQRRQRRQKVQRKRQKGSAEWTKGSAKATNGSAKATKGSAKADKRFSESDKRLSGVDKRLSGMESDLSIDAPNSSEDHCEFRGRNYTLTSDTDDGEAVIDVDLDFEMDESHVFRPVVLQSNASEVSCTDSTKALLS